MFLLLVAALAGNWSYEGFASEPVQPGPVKPESRAPGRIETVMPTLALVPSPPTPPASTVEVAPGSVVAAGPASAPKSPSTRTIKTDSPSHPILWRLADVGGEVWEHADREWLRYWVTYRNTRLAESRYEVVTPVLDGTCTSGRCKGAR
jgi:hypothetical protein